MMMTLHDASENKSVTGDLKDNIMFVCFSIFDTDDTGDTDNDDDIHDTSENTSIRGDLKDKISDANDDINETIVRELPC